MKFIFDRKKNNQIEGVQGPEETRKVNKFSFYKDV
jgi:hypothetical protein